MPPPNEAPPDGHQTLWRADVFAECLLLFDSLDLHRDLNTEEQSWEVSDSFTDCTRGVGEGRGWPYVQRRSTLNACCTAVNVIEDALRLYTANRVYLAWNGGKDSLVALHLFASVHANRERFEQQPPCRPRAVYFQSRDSHVQAEMAIRKEAQLLDYDLSIIQGGIKAGLDEFINQLPNSHIAFILGTKSSDPSTLTATFLPSSKWTLPFLRINPLAHWTFGDIWDFIGWQRIEFGHHYRHGFTSLGEIWGLDGQQNPYLRVRDDKVTQEAQAGGRDLEQSTYHPAYCLLPPFWCKERCGRSKTAKDNEDIPEAWLFSRCDIEPFRVELEKTLVPSTGLVQLAWLRYVANARSVGILFVAPQLSVCPVTFESVMHAIEGLKETGLKIQRATALSDNTEDVTLELRQQMSKYEIIITTSNLELNSTDVILNAVAAATNQLRVPHQKMKSFLRRWHKVLNDDALPPEVASMAQLPEMVQVIELQSEPEEWPLLLCQNILIVRSFRSPLVDYIKLIRAAAPGGANRDEV